MGIDDKEIRRMLYPRYPSKTPAIERALLTLGRYVIAEVAKAV